jgi:hypothetical protein
VDHPDSVPPLWQKIEGAWLVCHSWQDLAQGKVTAMNSTLFLVLLITIALAGAASALARPVFRGDGLIDSRRSPLPPNRDTFEQSIRRLY